ncbi:wd repeat-containing protein jip5 [Anaeramoeba flamelloides]|uniref:Wd repeat-containing protein jip5 n=1 Tax=Anaeramoeba flamelloides TaxID=1746091 RepID=A0ABQ8YV20_9EUKA|nr:wd repeat-containing protein jip5 [Anaeramoeba flamelloides]
MNIFEEESDSDNEAYEGLVESRHIPNTSFDDPLICFNLHHEQNLVAAGLVTGKIKMIQFSKDEQKEVAEFNYHKESCRSVLFSHQENILYTGSKDRSICVYDLENFSQAMFIEDAHDDAINCLYEIGKNRLISGDDGGVIKIWDLRQEKAIKTIEENDDYITALKTDSAETTLLATSGDGSLTSYNLLKNELITVSEIYDDDLLSMEIIKDGSVLLCGTMSGAMLIFKWEFFGDKTDLFPGHQQAVTSIIPFDQDSVITGSEDGFIRLIGIYPNKFYGIIGQQNEAIDNLEFSHDKSYLVSSSSYGELQYFDALFLFDDNEDGNENEKQNENENEKSTMGIKNMNQEQPKKRKKKKKKRNKNKNKKNNFIGKNQNNFFDKL